MTFSLFDLVLLLGIFLIGVQFWRVRAISERANAFLQQYCEKNQLQLISVARSKTRIGAFRGKLDWQTEFRFEFSGNGEDSYQGLLTMAGLYVVNTHLPAYKIN
ncbi:DUF3301 domain-containing protein [Aestuariibacter sp. AA17]|uniref:DUF3301 domain-containing protein n=1 Tax=Fluctibacter corallii TaxID=2984329 RepID=A0ABT3A8I2_9ALTE|nr:DUF3301 domain-containing protein [Aestuariibacter sp. AA17]MCV2884976.1 DUF3301 domain-containing protein [Aestuariibacter sp. AA17]